MSLSTKPIAETHSFPGMHEIAISNDGHRAKVQLEEMQIEVAETAVGDPVEQIAEAGQDYSVIAISYSGRSRLKRFLIGSVAFGVMGSSTMSVLNVR